MTNFIMPPPSPIALPVVGSDKQFAVRRIYCVGKNYADHVREMGGDPNTSTPVFFTKSRETIVRSGAKIPYPPQTNDLHFEVELLVAMASATEIFGYGTALDMTRRDQQAVAKAKGGPWDMAKNFDHCAPCSALTRASDTPDLTNAGITLSLDGGIKQQSTLAHMIWSVADIIKHLNQSITVQAGDLILTGTPHGVGPVIAGQCLIGSIDGLEDITVRYY